MLAAETPKHTCGTVGPFGDCFLHRLGKSNKVTL
jgi:hypothetical protein